LPPRPDRSGRGNDTGAGGYETRPYGLWRGIASRHEANHSAGVVQPACAEASAKASGQKPCTTEIATSRQVGSRNDVGGREGVGNDSAVDRALAMHGGGEEARHDTGKRARNDTWGPLRNTGETRYNGGEQNQRRPADSDLKHGSTRRKE
jgi:hypothetical protein